MIFLKGERALSEAFSRSELLLGPEAMERLSRARVAVFGIGGVGGHAAEALVRAGVGALDLIDNDDVAVSNLNRQMFALRSTVGMAKVDAARQRLLDINPELDLRTYRCFYLPETAEQFDFAQYDYVLDAIDTVTGKLMLVQQAHDAKTPIISVMGAGNKLDPTRFEVTDLSKTTICPLARVMRKELKKRGIAHLKVVYSTEEPLTPAPSREETARRAVPGSVSFVPGVAGMIAAGEIIKDLIKDCSHES